MSLTYSPSPRPTPPMWKTARPLTAVAFCLLPLAGVGCTRSGKVRTRVSGTVTAAGKPLKHGRITFRPVAGGKSYSAGIHAGEYRVRSRTRLPAGEYDVTVEYSSGPGRTAADFHLE